MREPRSGLSASAIAFGSPALRSSRATIRRSIRTAFAIFETSFSLSFPTIRTGSAGEGWAGLRPVTPDGCPYLGPTPIEGLYLNTGHGHLGWTMACGSAHIVADLICGRDPEIDL